MKSHKFITFMDENPTQFNLTCLTAWMFDVHKQIWSFAWDTSAAYIFYDFGSSSTSWLGNWMASIIINMNIISQVPSIPRSLFNGEMFGNFGNNGKNHRNVEINQKSTRKIEGKTCHVYRNLSGDGLRLFTLQIAISEDCASLLKSHPNYKSNNYLPLLTQ